MAIDSDEKIAGALFARVASLVTSPVTQVVHQNVKEPASLVRPYLRVNLIPIDGQRQSQVGKIKRHDGILQLSIVDSEGVGILRSKRILGYIADHFKQDSFWSADGVEVSITRPPFDSSPFISDSEMITPVNIYYTSTSTDN